MARRLRRAKLSPRPWAPIRPTNNYHNNYQDAEAFLLAGGRRGRQYLPLTDGTYFINRWFASVEINSQNRRADRLRRRGRQLLRPAGAKILSGDCLPARRARGRRSSAAFGSGRWDRANIRSTRSPATSFWCRPRTSCCTGSPARSESHRYDESLKSIDLVTNDAYEPLLPLSVVVHIDYQRAPSVIQRFGDVKTADYANARSDAVGLLPRRGAQENDARAVAPAR